MSGADRVSLSTRPKPIWVARPIAWRLQRRRGHKRVFESLVSRMAEVRTCRPGGGGGWSPITGNGEAFHKWSDNTWFRLRPIKRGQFIGPWQYKRVSEI